MFKDMYSTFDDKCIPYSYPFSFQDNKKEYMISNEPTYEMDYGDTAIFPFCISDEFANFLIHIIIYNFRGEELYRESLYPDEHSKVYLNIDSDTSASIFKRGIYKCQVQAVGLVNNLERVCTLIPADQCLIYVR